MAFIGQSLLFSLKNKKIISYEIFNPFIDSIETVATNIDKAFDDLKNGKLSSDEFTANMVTLDLELMILQSYHIQKMKRILILTIIQNFLKMIN